MIKILGKFPTTPFHFACSGGADSMTALSFLLAGKHWPESVLYFDHGTKHGEEAYEFVRQFCENNGLIFNSSDIKRYSPKQSNESQEEYWARCRNEYFKAWAPELVLTAHNLDDAVEWWVFSSLHGKGKITPFKNENVCRPFLAVSKKDFAQWRQNHPVSWVEDPSNADTHYNRNRIRHELLPIALKVNPGLYTVIRKKIELEYLENIERV